MNIKDFRKKTKLSQSQFAEKYGIPAVAKLPIYPKLASEADRGVVEGFDGHWLDSMADYLETL